VAEKTAKEIKINKMPLPEFLFFSIFTNVLLDYLLIKVYFSFVYQIMILYRSTLKYNGR